MLKKQKRILRAAMLALGLAPLGATPALATDLNSQDIVPAAPETDLALVYFDFATRDSFKPEGGEEITDGTELNSFVTILRLAHYMKLGDMTFAPQILIPAGTLFDGSIAGNKMGSDTGFGDPVLVAPLWFVHDTPSKTNLAIIPYLTVPVGSFDTDRPLNLGENRWKLDVQLAGTQSFGTSGVTAQLSLDAIWYGKNKEGPGGTRLTQDDSYQGQAWLSYTPPKDASWTYAVGYSKMWGGRQYLDDTPNGLATKNDQIRAEVSKFVAPRFQIQGLVRRDLNVDGGFKQDLGIVIRLLRVM